MTLPIISQFFDVDSCSFIFIKENSTIDISHVCAALHNVSLKLEERATRSNVLMPINLLKPPWITLNDQHFIRKQTLLTPLMTLQTSVKFWGQLFLPKIWRRYVWGHYVRIFNNNRAKKYYIRLVVKMGSLQMIFLESHHLLLQDC